MKAKRTDIPQKWYIYLGLWALPTCIGKIFLTVIVFSLPRLSILFFPDWINKTTGYHRCVHLVKHVFWLLHELRISKPACVKHILFRSRAFQIFETVNLRKMRMPIYPTHAQRESPHAQVAYALRQNFSFRDPNNQNRTTLVIVKYVE